VTNCPYLRTQGVVAGGLVNTRQHFSYSGLSYFL